MIGSTGEVAGLAQIRLPAEHASAATPAFAAGDVAAQIAALRAGFGLLPAPCCMLDPLRPAVARALRAAFDVALDLWLLVDRRLRAVEPSPPSTTSSRRLASPTGRCSRGGPPTRRRAFTFSKAPLRR